MEKKKTNRADLENKKVIFLQIGLIAALAICLLAFEWRSYESYIYEKPSTDWLEIDELLPVNTEQRKILPPPPAANPVYEIVIVENTADVIDDFPFIDAGFNQDWQNPDLIYLPEEVSDQADDTIYSTYSIEVQPEFPGGEDAMYEYLGKNIKYPKMAVEVGIQGTVYIGFVVEKDGSLSGIGIVRSPDQTLSSETLRVVSGMPNWTPGRQGGIPVRVSFHLPVKFQLQ
jgi:periplasmic protein TonB